MGHVHAMGSLIGKVASTAKVPIIVFSLGCCLSGCLAFGIPYTSDPGQKMAYAFQLIDTGRPIPAERLLREALETLQANKDELGMANAYLLFGVLYQSKGYHKMEKYFKDAGTYEGWEDRSKENFLSAAELYEKYENLIFAAKAYIGVGNAYNFQGNRDKACAWYNKAMNTFDRAISANPATAQIEVIDIREQIAYYKNKNTC